MRRSAFALLLLLSLPALALITLPLVGLCSCMRIGSLGACVCCREASSALTLSLITSGIAAAVITLIGTPFAYWLAYCDFRGKKVVETLVDLPIVLPPAVAGVALLFTLGARGLLGQYLAVAHIRLPFTTAAVVLAQMFVAGPFYFRQARIGFQGVPQPLLLASRTLGASAFRAFRQVILPLASPALIAGLIMAWARAVGEFGATLVFAGSLQGVTRTMPLAIYNSMDADPTHATAVVLSVALVTICFLVIIITRAVLTRAAGLQETSRA